MSESLVVRWGSSMLYLEGFGYIFVLHDVEEDPLAELNRYGDTGEGSLLGGPFVTEEEANEAGSAALTRAMETLNRNGFTARRLAKD